MISTHIIHLLSCNADSRVDDAVENINDHVAEHQERAVKGRHSQNQGVIVILNALHIVFSHAGDRKQGLNDKGPGQHSRHGGAHHGHNRHDGVAHLVLDRHAETGNPLGAGGLDIILLHHLQHAGAHDARDRGHGVKAQADGGEDRIAEALILRDRKKAPFYPKEMLKQSAHNKVRDAGADHGDENKKTNLSYCPCLRPK